MLYVMRRRTARCSAAAVSVTRDVIEGGIYREGLNRFKAISFREGF